MLGLNKGRYSKTGNVERDKNINRKWGDNWEEEVREKEIYQNKNHKEYKWKGKEYKKKEQSFSTL